MDFFLASSTSLPIPQLRFRLLGATSACFTPTASRKPTAQIMWNLVPNASASFSLPSEVLRLTSSPTACSMSCPIGPPAAEAKTLTTTSPWSRFTSKLPAQSPSPRLPTTASKLTRFVGIVPQNFSRSDGFFEGSGDGLHVALHCLLGLGFDHDAGELLSSRVADDDASVTIELAFGGAHGFHHRGQLLQRELLAHFDVL